MPEEDREGIEAQLKRIGDLCAERKRDDYESLHARLMEAREQFHELLAGRLAQAFNKHLASLPQDTLQEKRDLARHANADLRHLGLAVKCPKTGEPAMFYGDPGHIPDKGRFQLGLVSEEAARKRTFTSQTLFQVELMGRPVRREPLAEWAERAARGTVPPKGR